MKLLSALIVILTAFFVAWTRYRLKLWEESVLVMRDSILEEPLQSRTSKQSWEEIPAVVQEYLNRAVPDGSHLVHSLSIEQEGEFALKPDQWVPFGASQLVRVDPPGFVWDSTVAMQRTRKWPMVQVVDAWVKGEGTMRAALFSVLDFPEPKGQSRELLSLGEALRWLAEAPLVPTALLPEAGLVTWSALEGEEDDSKARLTLQDPFAAEWEAMLTVTFKNGWMAQIDGIRPAWNDAKELFEQRAWQGFFYDYQEETLPDGSKIWVPRRMECGWVNEESGSLELYFKGINESLDYQSTVLIKKGSASKMEEATVSATSY